jgi:5-methylcytosine-specific restriction endonuclease McrA
MNSGRVKPGICLTCKEAFDTKSYAKGGGWYCSPKCLAVKKAKKLALRQKAESAQPKAKRGQSYDAYINSSLWQRLRVEALRMAGNRCAKCGSGGPGLHVHHLTYERFTRERLSDLQVLCPTCHNELHRQRDAERKPSKSRKRRPKGSTGLGT